MTALNITEILANTSADRRSQLFDLCKLFVIDGRCLAPHHWIIERLVTMHWKGGSFDWRAVNVGFRGGEIEIARQQIISDQLARDEREHLRKHEKDLFDYLDKRRDTFQEVFDKGTRQPSNYADFISVLQGPGGAFWTFGAGMYQRVTGVVLDEKSIRKFVDACPPLGAALLGVFVAYYERCIRDLKTGPSFRAGRYDLFMSVYLPYCDQFITDDDKQRRSLQEVTSVGGFSTEVRAYKEWRRGFTLMI